VCHRSPCRFDIGERTRAAREAKAACQANRWSRVDRKIALSERESSPIYAEGLSQRASDKQVRLSRKDEGEGWSCRRTVRREGCERVRRIDASSSDLC
jgi:hypothetical protein